MAKLLMVAPDLFFATRIEDVARRLGYSIDSPRTAETPKETIARVSPVLVVLSLEAPAWQQVVEVARAAGCGVLAFGAHMNVELMRAAKEAGCDPVVARSRMAAELPHLLQVGVTRNSAGRGKAENNAAS